MSDKNYVLAEIDNAIWYWGEKKTPNRFWWDKSEYTPEYCDTQIEYFKAMRSKYIKFGFI